MAAGATEGYTFKEIDSLCGRAKGAAFRAFRRIESELTEDRDFRCVDARRDPAAVAALRAAGRVYPSTVNAVLLADDAARRVRAILDGEAP